MGGGGDWNATVREGPEKSTAGKYGHGILNTRKQGQLSLDSWKS